MNKKIGAIELSILLFSLLFVILDSPIRNYIPLEKKTRFYIAVGLFCAIALLGLVFIFLGFSKNGKIPRPVVGDSILVIKSNYVFFVLTYLFIFLISPQLYQTKIEVLTNFIDRILYERILVRIQNLLYLLIVAPVMEELFFRRLLFRLLRKLKINWIIVITSILFMISHDNTDISKFIVGVGLSRLYIKYNRIELNIIIHSLLNLISLIMGIAITLIKPANTVNSLFMLIPFIFIIPNYKFWIEKLFVKHLKVHKDF